MSQLGNARRRHAPDPHPARSTQARSVALARREIFYGRAVGVLLLPQLAAHAFHDRPRPVEEFHLLLNLESLDSIQGNCATALALSASSSGPCPATADVVRVPHLKGEVGGTPGEAFKT